MGDISVVVGTYNRRDLIEKCVDSVLRETKRLAKLYITDAGSTDGTVEYLKALNNPLAEPILVGKKLGQAQAYNDVFAKVQSRYVCWISDDNEIANGGIDLAAGILDAEPEVAMVGMKVKDLQGPFAKAPYIGGVSELGILNVNQGMLRTDVLKAVGGFSLAFRDYGIDPDLTAKVLLHGHDVVYTREVCILHHRGWETDPSKPEFAAMQKRQEVYKALYRQKYAKAFAPSPFYLAKRGAWKLARGLMGPRFKINSSEPVFGWLQRDWNNMLSSRHISVFDPLISNGKPWYLRQRAPRGAGPNALPPDPPMAPTIQNGACDSGS
jgi:GT2 family glycosyltransferase